MSAVPPPSSTVPVNPKALRVLACVLCQNRKIKCDRNSPCANCVKANVVCTPSTPAPARKRRRPNHDLQQRLAKCEELLSEYATAAKQPSAESAASQDEPWRPMGKLINDGSGPKFMDSYMWANIHDELHAMREILDNDEGEDDYSTPTDGGTCSPGHNSSLIFPNTSTTSAKDYRPAPSHIFSLWQTFLDRVNPLTKIIHVPTLQGKVNEAATNPDSVPQNMEALLFSIYMMAAVSLSDEECVALIGCHKIDAISRFSNGARLAFIQIDILKTYDLVILQALLLYMTSLLGRYDRHATWILNGVVIRIAQKMGLHRDGESLGLSPFDSEIRRRIWWHLLLLDAIYALMSGLGQSLLPRDWDTKSPANLNDSDIFPGMTSIQPREGPTDMIFLLVQYEITKLVLNQSPSLEAIIFQNETGTFHGGDTPDLAKARDRIEETNQNIDQIISRYSDVSMGPVHELASSLRDMFICKLRDLVRPPLDSDDWGDEVKNSKDHLFKLAVVSNQHSLELFELTSEKRTFHWFIKTHFQLEVVFYMVSQLCTRTSGVLVERAWWCMEMFYKYVPELFDLAVKQHLSFATLVVRAWKKREKALQETMGYPPEKPYWVTQLQRSLVAHDQNHTPASDPPSVRNLNMDSEPTSAEATPASWDQMLGLGMIEGPTMNSMSWDMFPPSEQSMQFGAFPGPFGSNMDNTWL